MEALQQLEQAAKEDERSERVNSLERREDTDAALLSRATINQLKAIVAGWDQRRTATGDGAATVEAERLKAVIADWDKREAEPSTRWRVLFVPADKFDEGRECALVSVSNGVAQL